MNQQGTENNSLADRGEASGPLTAGEAQTRIGGVELTEVSLTRGLHLDESDDFQRMTGRLEISEQVVKKLKARGEFHLESLLVQALDQLVAAGQLSGMMIASEDGLLVAQSTGAKRAEIFAAVGSLFERTVRRAQSEHLIESVEEMMLRGMTGELIVVRYFPGPEKRFFLIAYSEKACAYRRVTTRALKLCGDLLLHSRRPKEAPPRPPQNSESGETPETPPACLAQTPAAPKDEPPAAGALQESAPPGHRTGASQQ